MCMYVCMCVHAFGNLSLALSLNVVCVKGKRWRSDKMYITSRNIRLVMLPPDLNPMQAMKNYVRARTLLLLPTRARTDSHSNDDAVAEYA